MKPVMLLCMLASIASVAMWQQFPGVEIPTKQPAKAVSEEVIFGAGCFWGVEATFAGVPGVTGTKTGYSGGTTTNPTYEAVCSHTTGHAEVVKVEYDPMRVSFDALLDVFWQCHDPTKPVRPGGGGQYRSAIFFATPEQEAAARRSAERLVASGAVSGPITTQIAPAAVFYPAEDYHQQYYARQGGGRCRLP